MPVFLREWVHGKRVRVKTSAQAKRLASFIDAKVPSATTPTPSRLYGLAPLQWPQEVKYKLLYMAVASPLDSDRSQHSVEVLLLLQFWCYSA